MTPEVDMRGITKRFPGVLADDRVDFQVRTGEIHALMGENGAGKSILMSILAGLYQPDEGEIHIRGQRVSIASPLDAIDAGVGMVFQAFKLFPSLSVTENVIFRQEPTRGGLIDRRTARRKVVELAERYGLAIDPDARVESCTVGVLQRVEIVKALYRDARILILDEPTAVLTPQETDRLFEVLRRLRDDGCTIILITHKMKEVMAVSDRVTVLRDGRNVATLVTAESSPQEITTYMVGRDVDLSQAPPANDPGEPILVVKDLVVEGAGSRPVVDHVSFSIRQGEILGVAGVAGNGQAELAEALMGLRDARSGSIHVAGNDVSDESVLRRRTRGMSYVPENRHGVGTAPTADAAANLSMGHHRSAPLLSRGLLARSRMVEHATRLIKRFQIRISGAETAVGTLSGGNQQKIVVAREMDHDAPLLIAEQPTRGVDVGAIEAIHKEIADYRDRGRAVLLISAELSEILSLSGRIIVMFEGRVVADLDAAEATEANLGHLMAGGHVEEHEVQ